MMKGKGITISPVSTDERRNLDLRSGDTVRVWTKILEGGKARLQAFDGLVLARKHGSEPGATFTVRKVLDGIGVERIFPLYSPTIDKIEILKRSKVRRAKLYYIREKATKEIRRHMRHVRMAVEPKDSAEAIEVKPSAEGKLETSEVKK